MPTPIINHIIRYNNNYILDQVRGASAAYSLDKISSKATSPCTISFSIAIPNMVVPFLNNTFDMTSVQAYIIANGGNFATTSAYVDICRDQTGNGNHAIQNTAANQPRILHNGVWELDSNGKLAMQIIQANDSHMIITNNDTINITTNGAFNFVHTPASLGENSLGRFLEKTGQYNINKSSSNKITINATTPTTSNIFTLNNTNINTLNIGNATVTFTKNGNVIENNAIASFGTNTNNLYLFNRSTLDRSYNGKFYEMIIYNRTLTSAELQKLERNQGIDIK